MVSVLNKDFISLEALIVIMNDQVKLLKNCGDHRILSNTLMFAALSAMPRQGSQYRSLEVVSELYQRHKGKTSIL